MRGRIVFIFVCVVALWGLIVFRAAYIQILPNAKLEQLHQRQFSTTLKLNPRRGSLLDRNGKELAVSIPAHSLYADPQLIRKPRALGDRLGRVLGKDPSALKKRLADKDRRFVWIERRVSAEMKNKIQAWKEPGLQFIEEARRIYPNEAVLAPVLGLVGSEGQGLEGLELKLEPILRGEAREVRVQRDAHGRPLILGSNILTDLPEGDDVELTIDSELQYFLEEELMASVRKHLAEGALGIVMDAKTSEILAMASVGDSSLRRNRAITDPIEPGSTLKTFTVAAALREKLAVPNTKFNCEKGKFQIGKRTIREADEKHVWEWLTLSDILAYSSNVGSAKVGLELGDQRLFKTLRDFGFGERTGVELPGESRGILPPPPWKEHLLATISFGHSAAVTPLQMTNAYAAIANGGILRKPQIVKARISKKDRRKVPFEGEVVRRVISEKEAATLRLALTSVTSLGTGHNAKVAGFPVAGKTGTAQKANLEAGGYRDKAYISSFVGMIPSNDPRFVVLVLVDDPKLGYYGSDVAAPVFSRVAGFAVRRSGLSPALINAGDLLGRASSWESRGEPPAVSPQSRAWSLLRGAQALVE